jgi:hypothetical protein
VRCTCMWQLDNEYSCCCIEPQSPINVGKENDDNSATREPTLIKICSQLLDANMSQGRTSPSDSLHLSKTCKVVVKRGWVKGCKWSWSKVLTMCQQRKLRLVWACHGTSSELSYYINYLNSLFCPTFSSVVSCSETSFKILVPRKVMAHAPR